MQNIIWFFHLKNVYSLLPSFLVAQEAHEENRTSEGRKHGDWRSQTEQVQMPASWSLDGWIQETTDELRGGMSQPEEI